MSRVTYGLGVAASLVGLAVLSGACGAGSDDASRTPTSASASASPVQGSDTTEPAAGEETPAQRCTGERGPGHERVIRAGGSRLVGAELGHGTTWAVFLHQTGGSGLCGWWTYGDRVAGQGVHVLLLDLCGYGRSTCAGRLSGDQIGQAATAVAYARRRGAERVTIVGASMGGAVALPAARASRADAVVDLSGPPDWTGTDLAQDARRLTMPTLLAISPSDSSSVPAFRKAIRHVPADVKRLEVVSGGHGIEMLGYPGNWSRLATTVQRWIVGDYS
ncbi:MAG: alpha/beta fold hydrolase [Nocardioidaceae bacterium]|nr:alpha/beta fold hydrolase [Nocardioidaceae bacterium]